MSVLERSALVDSPLADLHAIASELTIDGFRRLRRDDLVEAILARQAGTEPADVSEGAPDASDGDAEETGSRRRRGRRGGRSRSAASDDDAAAEPETTAAEPVDDDASPESGEPTRRTRRRRGAKAPSDDIDAEVAASQSGAEEPAIAARSRRSRGRTDEAAPSEHRAEKDEMVSGVVEILPGGSGFVRVNGPESSDGDVYISSAQVKRCELVAGDTVSGPKRAPRRSERYPSLIRVETINGRPASEQADSGRFEDLGTVLPSERITFGSDDVTLETIEWLTPFGRGSRVAVTGAARSGKTETLRRIAAALASDTALTVSVALIGVRPEEIDEWKRGGVDPVAAVSFAAAPDVQAAALEPVIDQACRLAARGEHAVVLVDGLDGIAPQAARKLTVNARALADGGSVTIVATGSAPVGGETTVIALDVEQCATGHFPALDLIASGTLRPELLVGEESARSIARTRAGEDED